jgi:hypothetical protein
MIYTLILLFNPPAVDSKKRRTFQSPLSLLYIFTQFIICRKIKFLRREELVKREFDGIKDLARLLVGGSYAFLVGVAEIECRNKELYQPNQFYDGEQSQCYNHPSLRKNNVFGITLFLIIAKAMFMVMVVVMYPLNPRIQNQGLCNLNLHIGQIILLNKGSAAAVTAGIAIEGAIRCGVHTLEDLDLAFRSEEDNCFFKPHKPNLWARGNQVSIHIPVAEFHHDLDLIAYIYGVKTSFEWYGFQICKYGHYLGIFSFYLYRIIDEVLNIFIKIYNRILNTVFLAAIVIYFFHVDANGFTELAYVFAAD